MVSSGSRSGQDERRAERGRFRVLRQYAQTTYGIETPEKWDQYGGKYLNGPCRILSIWYHTILFIRHGNALWYHLESVKGHGQVG